MIFTLLGNLISPITQIIKGYQQKKQVKLENEMAIARAATNAKIERMQTKQESDISWENTALTQSGLKDEAMFIIICTPMVMCFFPGGAEVVAQGFTAINETIPEFWQWAFMATVGVSYGLRKFTDLVGFMKGGK